MQENNKAPKTILIIENQYSQFGQLLKALSSNLLPIKINIRSADKKDFVHLISAVKVYLNSDYNRDYREKCLAFILDQVGGEKRRDPVDLIIMDYKLCGSSVGSDGIELAKKIWEIFYSVPILFLSREDPFRKDILFKKRKIKYRYRWLKKGFLGEDSLAGDYIKFIVYNEIIQLTNWTTEDIVSINGQIITQVEHILTLSGEPGDMTVWENLLHYLEESWKPLPADLVEEISEHSKSNNSIVTDDLRQLILAVIENGSQENEVEDKEV